MAPVARALFTLIVCCLHSQRVAAEGLLQFQLRRFDNVQSVLESGECCVAGSSRVRGVCVSSCTTAFSVCLTNYKARLLTDIACEPYGMHNISHVFDSSSFTVDSAHTISVRFDFSWPGSFGAIIRAFNQRPTGESDVIIALPWQALLEVSEVWQEEMHSDKGIRLEFAYRVTCAANYYGRDCNKHCQARDDEFGHYTCTSLGERACLPGWTGNYCHEAVCNTPCANGGKCTAPNTCSCKDGWQGQTCGQCQTFPGCNATHGYCVTAMQCLCRPGWGGNYCNRDLNFCTSRAPCLNGGTCINTDGGYYNCSCPPGYTGVNCEVKFGMCRQHHCQNGGTCTDNYMCQCPRGFHGNLCEHVANDCSDQPCHNGAGCKSSTSGYECTCPDGYSGVNCELPSQPCLSSPCLNGGKCIQNGTSFHCQCAYGFAGDTCNTDIDDCHTSPCLNGGSCVDQPDGYQCQCRLGYGGHLCEELVGCESMPCANDGLCQKLEAGGVRCLCLPGYTGANCAVRIESCATRPCLNGATCLDGPEGYECTCAANFSGRQCEDPVVGIGSSVEEPVVDLRQLLLILGLGAGLPFVIICFIMVVMVHQRRRLLRAIEMQNHNLRMGIENDSNEQHQQTMNNRLPVKKIVNDLSGGGGRTASSSSAGSSKSLLGSSRCADIHKGGTLLLAGYTRSQSHHVLQQHDDDACCQKGAWAATAGCCNTMDGGAKLRAGRDYADDARAERRRSKLSTFEAGGMLRPHLPVGKKVDNVTSKNINTDTGTLKGVDQKTSWRARDSVFCSSSEDASCTEQLLLSSPDGAACHHHLAVDSRDDVLEAEQAGHSVLLNPQHWLSAATRPPPLSHAPPSAGGTLTAPDTSVFVVDANRGSRQYRSVVLATEV